MDLDFTANSRRMKTQDGEREEEFHFFSFHSLSYQVVQEVTKRAELGNEGAIKEAIWGSLFPSSPSKMDALLIK